MKSTRSRSRSKNNRNRQQNSGGNVVNRVFDSSGPEGKVRGTPSQVIEKYNQLARDATLSNDRVAAENFQQHAEHYLRMLAEAQREQDQRREEQERQNRERQEEQDRQNRERQAERDRERAERQEREAANGGGQQQHGNDHGSGDQSEQPQPQHHADVAADANNGGDSNLVETPESKPKPKRAPRRKPKPKVEKPQGDGGSEGGGDQPEAAE